MARVEDVAEYILRKSGQMTAMKLQKLCYYSQAWHLVWEEKPLFDDPIQAWANGPVIRALYDKHKGLFYVSSIAGGNPDNLTEAEKTTIDAVLDAYGHLTAYDLSALTHSEAPWKDARGNLAPGMSCENVITPVAMHEYYSAFTE